MRPSSMKGSEQVQGYLFGKLMPAVDFERLASAPVTTASTRASNLMLSHTNHFEASHMNLAEPSARPRLILLEVVLCCS